MGVLTGLQPEKVFYYFEEITGIPHGSGNVKGISDYIKNFAQNRNIPVIQDELNNIIMFSDASEGYEEEPIIIFQGHMDMVAVHKPEFNIDMKKEGLKLGIEGDQIYAEGTSLGGDDGIAVAYILAILDSPEIKHPRLEIIITVDEEVGMDGAAFIDVSMLQGKRLLNLDSEEEGIFLASCAGGARIDCHVGVKEEQCTGLLMELRISGLQGGHSGCEIHKERGNANMLMARALLKLSKLQGVSLISCEGGLADNAIPRECRAKLLINAESSVQLQEVLEQLKKELMHEYSTRDPQVCLEYSFDEKLEVLNLQAITGSDLEKAAAFLHGLPNGVMAMSMDIQGLVETSLNLGIMKICEGQVTAQFAVRSSVESSKEALLDKVISITALAGGTCNISGKYPGWSYKKDSAFRDKLVRVYEEMYGSSPKVEAIHAGLECGLLAGKIEGLDCISMGPDMKDIHTTEETLSIASTQRVWEYLIKVLETKENTR